jgi:hypothetical protein
MSSEAFGFLAGFACVAVGGVVFYYLEIWRAIQRAHGRKPDGARRGNALIWPSH